MEGIEGGGILERLPVCVETAFLWPASPSDAHGSGLYPSRSDQGGMLSYWSVSLSSDLPLLPI